MNISSFFTQYEIKSNGCLPGINLSVKNVNIKHPIPGMTIDIPSKSSMELDFDSQPFLPM